MNQPFDKKRIKRCQQFQCLIPLYERYSFANSSWHIQADIPFISNIQPFYIQLFFLPYQLVCMHFWLYSWPIFLFEKHILILRCSTFGTPFHLFHVLFLVLIFWRWFPPYCKIMLNFLNHSVKKIQKGRSFWMIWNQIELKTFIQTTWMVLASNVGN